MANQLTLQEITQRMRSLNHRLTGNREDLRNADRALWGAFAIVSFAGVTGQSQDVQTDPETVLGDLLGDLMHWCDDQRTSGGIAESIDFESALERARDHYNEEYADERKDI